MTREIFVYAVGPLCQLRETATSENIRQRCSALPQYIATLREVSGTLCNPGRPGTLVWIPDENTPDTVYYQVIHVPHQPFLRRKKILLIEAIVLFQGVSTGQYRAVLYNVMIIAIGPHHKRLQLHTETMLMAPYSTL